MSFKRDHGCRVDYRAACRKVRQHSFCHIKIRKNIAFEGMHELILINIQYAVPKIMLHNRWQERFARQAKSKDDVVTLMKRITPRLFHGIIVSKKRLMQQKTATIP